MHLLGDGHPTVLLDQADEHRVERGAVLAQRAHWRARRRQCVEQHRYGLLGVVHRHAERLIGRCGLRINPYAGSADVGYWIDGDYEGRGIVRRATHALVSMAFAELELNRVELRTSVENARSRGLAERLGFKFEGVLPGGLRFIHRNDDVAMYCVMAADWPRIAD